MRFYFFDRILGGVDSLWSLYIKGSNFFGRGVDWAVGAVGANCNSPLLALTRPYSPRRQGATTSRLLYLRQSGADHFGDCFDFNEEAVVTII